MSKNKHIISLVLISLIICIKAMAIQIEPIGPFGGTFECIAISKSNSNVMFTGTTTGGIYKSTNAGDSWTYVGFRGKQITSIAIDCIDPDLVYLSWRSSSTGNSAACKSTDGGATWSEIMSPARVVQTSSLISDFVFVGNNDGLYKSIDAATNLRLIDYEFRLNNLEEICSDPVDSNIFYLGTVYAVYKSIDKGETWSQLRYLNEDSPSAEYTNDITVSSLNNNIVLVATSLNGLLISYDGGVNWTQYDRLGGQSHGVICDMNDENTLYIASLGGFYKSTDKGVTFTEIKDGYLRGADMINGNFYLIDSRFGTIYKSQDNGQTWIESINGISNVQVNSITINSNEVVSSVKTGYRTRLMDYSDSKWDTLLIEDVGDDIYTSQDNQFLYMLGSWRYFSKSNSPFDNWVRFEDGIPYCVPNDLAINGDTLYFSSHTAFEGLYAGIYKSTDNGCNWVLSSNGLPTVTRQYLSSVHTGPIAVYTISIDPNKSNRLLAGANHTIYESQNSAENWSELITIDSVYITDVIIDPDNSNIIYTIAGNPYNYKPYLLYCSYDNGATIDVIDCGLSSVTSVYYSNEDNALFCGGQDGLVMTKDKGTTWEDIGNNWDGISITCINKCPGTDYLYVGTTQNGLYEIDMSTLSIENQEVPNQFTLHQNYPNPLNPTTTISYDLPEAQNIILQIFDITGRLVETLYNGYKEAGHWEQTWDASEQSSGIYIYRLTYGDRHISRKMLVLK